MKAREKCSQIKSWRPNGQGKCEPLYLVSVTFAHSPQETQLLDLSLTRWLFPAILQGEALNLQIFLEVFNRKVEVTVVAMSWRLVDAACRWTARSAWACRKTWGRWRWRTEVSKMIHMCSMIDHQLWCWHRESQGWRTVGCEYSLWCEVSSVHLRWLPVLGSCVVCWRVCKHLLLVHWLLCRHGCEDCIVTSIRLRSILVELKV